MPPGPSGIEPRPYWVVGMNFQRQLSGKQGKPRTHCSGLFHLSPGAKSKRLEDNKTTRQQDNKTTRHQDTRQHDNMTTTQQDNKT
ncbi:conserved hypothetical protein [Culex quinquefasciatus]|uniref:Uncharacterized protein n=1 Tax=Culex quinquefasciatus TaxID=7176 RepID=B0WGU7_CULQU|nr:conserved hypothetical protein [Culex quinquefasciatus]|eukprot:XP_001847931.1 conserved hypothetical protein [Culex quinquefasciatus]